MTLLSRGDMRHSSWCVSGALGPATGSPHLLTLPIPFLGSQALQCYSFEHTYFGPFDLSAMTFPSVSCPQGCSEAMLLLDTGEDLRAAKEGREKREEEKREEKGWRVRK